MGALPVTVAITRKPPPRLEPEILASEVVQRAYAGFRLELRRKTSNRRSRSLGVRNVSDVGRSPRGSARIAEWADGIHATPGLQKTPGRL